MELPEYIEIEEGYPRKEETKVSVAPKYAYELSSDVWLNYELCLPREKSKEPNGKLQLEGWKTQAGISMVACSHGDSSEFDSKKS